MYHNYSFQLYSYNGFLQNKFTFKCKYKRQTKNKNQDEKNFCNSTITAKRNHEYDTDFKFHFKKIIVNHVLINFQKLIIKIKK